METTRTHRTMDKTLNASHRTRNEADHAPGTGIPTSGVAESLLEGLLEKNCGCAQARESEEYAAGGKLPSESGSHRHGYVGSKEAYLRRMRRIEGQARGITRMIDEGKYCIDILTQISALTRALQGVGIGLLEDHLHHCVMDARASEDDMEVKLDEATKAIARLVRS